VSKLVTGAAGTGAGAACATGAPPKNSAPATAPAPSALAAAPRNDREEIIIGHSFRAHQTVAQDITSIFLGKQQKQWQLCCELLMRRLSLIAVNSQNALLRISALRKYANTEHPLVIMIAAAHRLSTEILVYATTRLCVSG
jgi:hypothetical protein